MYGSEAGTKIELLGGNSIGRLSCDGNATGAWRATSRRGWKKPPIEAPFTRDDAFPAPSAALPSGEALANSRREYGNYTQGS